MSIGIGSRGISNGLTDGIGIGRTGVPKQSFDPVDLFRTGRVGAAYAPWDISTLFQDSAGTTPVTASGDPVGLMLDVSGNGFHATQTTAASRPLYRFTNGTHKLEFDGVNNYLAVDTSLYFQNAFTFAASVAFRNIGVLTNQRIFSRWDGVNDGYLFGPSLPASDARILIRKSAVNTAATFADSYVADAVVQHTAVWDGSNEQVIYNGSGGAPAAVSAPLASNSVVNRIGWDEALSATGKMQGDLYGLVLIDNQLDESVRLRLESFLRSKAGI